MALLTAASLYAQAPAEPAKPGSAGDKPAPQEPANPSKDTPGGNTTPDPNAPAKPGSTGDKPATPPPNVPKGNGGN